MTLQIFCHCIFTSRLFIVIPKGTLNFSPWKCIVCWIVASVPRGVENNTPREILLPDILRCCVAPYSFCITVKPRRHNGTCCHMLQAHVWSCLCAKWVAESVDRWEEISAWIELQEDETGRWGEKHKRLPTSLCLWMAPLAASALKHCMRSLSFPQTAPVRWLWGRIIKFHFQRVLRELCHVLRP